MPPTSSLRGGESEHLPLSPRDFHILFALADGDCHGYGLVRAIEVQSDGTLKLDPANLYRAVQKLAADGLVADSERRPVRESHNERRRYYTLTARGRRVLVLEAERLRCVAEAAARKALIPPESAR